MQIHHKVCIWLTQYVLYCKMFPNLTILHIEMQHIERHESEKWKSILIKNLSCNTPKQAAENKRIIIA